MEDCIQVTSCAAGARGCVTSLAAQITFLASTRCIHVVAWRADTGTVDKLSVCLTSGAVVDAATDAGCTSVVAELAVTCCCHVVVESFAYTGAARGQQGIILAADAARVQSTGASGA